jgi:hypothetical protein
MTEQYGFDKALEKSLQQIQHDMRRTGKTTRMIGMLKHGDRVVTHSEVHASQLRHLIRARKIDAEVIVREPKPEVLRDMLGVGTSKGETVFEHTWVELYYQASISNASKLLNEMAVELSGWSEAHEETRRRALAAKIMDPNTTMQEAGQLQRELDAMAKPGQKFPGNDQVDPHDIASVIRYAGSRK